MPVTSVGVETLNLTGLIRNNELPLQPAAEQLTVTKRHGSESPRDRQARRLSAGRQGRSVKVQSHSTKQINDVAGWAGIDVNLSQFTVLAEVRTEGAIIDGLRDGDRQYQR